MVNGLFFKISIVETSDKIFVILRKEEDFPVNVDKRERFLLEAYQQAIVEDDHEKNLKLMKVLDVDNE